MNSMAQTPIMLDYAYSFIGAPYIWGGNGPYFDCSGFAQEVLASVGLDLPGDQTAQRLFDGLLARGWEECSNPGSLLFYGTTRDTISHVAVQYYNGLMLEAGAGDSKTVSIKDAIKRGAMVRMRPIRTNFIAAIRPVA